MLTRLHITILVFLAGATWTGALLLSGTPVTWDHLSPFATTVTALTAITLVFEKWLWNWPIFGGWLVKRPNFGGTWKAVLQSSYKDPRTGEQIAAIDGFMVVRQTFATLSMRLLTRESSSYLVVGKVIQHNDGIFEVTGVYQNEPDIHLRSDRSEIHFGALKLTIDADPPTELRGHYWTDRGTKGSLILSGRNVRLVASFDEGSALAP